MRDFGPGVTPELRDRVFDPYVQLEPGADHAQLRTGRGLGLTFCKVAVEAHGGVIWVEDAQPGAAFCLSLPHSEFSSAGESNAFEEHEAAALMQLF